MKTKEEIFEKYHKENKLVVYDDGTVESDKFQIIKMLNEYADQFKSEQERENKERGINKAIKKTVYELSDINTTEGARDYLESEGFNVGQLIKEGIVIIETIKARIEIENKIKELVKATLVMGGKRAREDYPTTEELEPLIEKHINSMTKRFLLLLNCSGHDKLKVEQESDAIKCLEFLLEEGLTFQGNYLQGKEPKELYSLYKQHKQTE